MTAALGAGIAVWVLPLADIGLRAWRILYVMPLLALPLTAARRPATAREPPVHRSARRGG